MRERALSFTEIQFWLSLKLTSMFPSWRRTIWMYLGHRLRCLWLALTLLYNVVRSLKRLPPWTLRIPELVQKYYNINIWISCRSKIHLWWYMVIGLPNSVGFDSFTRNSLVLVPDATLLNCWIDWINRQCSCLQVEFLTRLPSTTCKWRKH